VGEQAPGEAEAVTGLLQTLAWGLLGYVVLRVAIELLAGGDDDADR
jgi:hypothetical protein